LASKTLDKTANDRNQEEEAEIKDGDEVRKVYDNLFANEPQQRTVVPITSY